MNKAFEAAKNVLGIVAVGVGVFLFSVYVESGQILEAVVVPLPGTPVPVWVSEFRFASMLTMYITGSIATAFYLLLAFAFRLNDWRKAPKRSYWWGIGILAVLISTVVGFFAVSQPRSGGLLAYMFFALNSALFYYLVTVFFSPFSFKYIAPGARTLRPRWL